MILITGATGTVGSEVITALPVVPARGTAMVDENAEYAALTRAAIAASPDGTMSGLRKASSNSTTCAGSSARMLRYSLLTGAMVGGG